MSLYKNFKADPNLEKTGVFLQYGQNSKGKDIAIKIARAGGSNVMFAKILDVKTKPHRRMMANESLDPAIADKIMREVFADAVILGWENVEDENGKEMPFNRENVIKLLTDLPDLFRDIQAQATNLALFRAEALQAEAKN